MRARCGPCIVGGWVCSWPKGLCPRPQRWPPLCRLPALRGASEGKPSASPWSQEKRGWRDLQVSWALMVGVGMILAPTSVT